MHGNVLNRNPDSCFICLGLGFLILKKKSSLCFYSQVSIYVTSECDKQIPSFSGYRLPCSDRAVEILRAY